MKKQVENRDFVLYSPDNLKVLNEEIIKILPEKLDFYKKIFKINDFRQVKINLFDNLDDFRAFIHDLRGEKTSLPSYAIGTFDNGMINLYLDPKKTDILDKTYTITHELFHIMYKELILEKENKERIIWFDEGMAKLFSGENDYHQTDGKFNKFLDKFIDRNSSFPDLNTLKHGTFFETYEYSGYMQSFLAVKYLYDTLGEDDFLTLMHNINDIKEYGKNIVPKALVYYKNLIKQGKTVNI